MLAYRGTTWGDCLPIDGLPAHGGMLVHGCLRIASLSGNARRGDSSRGDCLPPFTCALPCRHHISTNQPPLCSPRSYPTCPPGIIRVLAILAHTYRKPTPRSSVQHNAFCASAAWPNISSITRYPSLVWPALLLVAGSPPNFLFRGDLPVTDDTVPWDAINATLHAA